MRSERRERLREVLRRQDLEGMSWAELDLRSDPREEEAERVYRESMSGSLSWLVRD